MKQILHIVAKDTRHLWREIVISLALVAALVLESHPDATTGRTDDMYGVTASNSLVGALYHAPQFLVAFLIVLIPLSWWIVIAPLIHEERLVGDRQFWVTRPYEWKKLLAAKTAFILLYVYVPLFAAQCMLLARAGLNPLPSISGLLYNLLMLTAVLILPVVALAAITHNFARLTLVVLGTIIPIVCIRWLASGFPNTHISTPFGDSLALLLFICGCIAIVLLMYAGRRRRAAWLVLASTLAVLTALACAVPDQALVNGRYPQERSPGIDLRSVHDNAAAAVASVASGPRDVVIKIPILVSGIPPRTMMIPEDVKATLEAADGSRWTSFWEPIYVDKLMSGERIIWASFAMPRSVFERLKGVPLHARIVLALARGRQDQTITIALPLNDFQIAGFGTCTPITGFFEKPNEIAGIGCRAALRAPQLTFVRVLWSYDDCQSPPPEPHTVQGEAWVGSLEPPLADFGIVPVWSGQIGFTNREPDDRFDSPRHICPGTPATFVSYQNAGRTQASLEIEGIVLPALSQGQQTVIEQP
jgi:hypothetical protein